MASQGVGQMCPGRPLAEWGLRGDTLRGVGAVGLREVDCHGLDSRRGLVPMLLRVLRVSELQLQQAVEVQVHGGIVGVCVLGCCLVVRWVYHVCARVMCGGWCGVAGRCPEECAVWRGCSVCWLAGGRLGLRFCPRVWFGLWLVVRAGLVCGLWGFWGWCQLGGGVWCGAGVLRCRSCVGGLRCLMFLGSVSWCVAVSRAGLSGEVHVGGGGKCGVVRWCWVVCWLPHGEGGHRAWVRRAGWLLVVGHRAVRGCPARSFGLPSGDPPSLARVGSLQPRARGPPGWGARDWSVATRGAWSRGAQVCRPTVLGVQRRAERRLLGGCGLPRLRVLRVGVSRCHGLVAAPVRRPWVVSGCVWLGCIFYMVGGGYWAGAWGGSVVGHRLVAAARASLQVGLPCRLLGVSRGGPSLAGCGGFLRRAASIGVPLCVARSLWGVRWVVGAWLVSVSTMGFAVVRCA